MEKSGVTADQGTRGEPKTAPVNETKPALPGASNGPSPTPPAAGSGSAGAEAASAGEGGSPAVSSTSSATKSESSASAPSNPGSGSEPPEAPGAGGPPTASGYAEGSRATASTDGAAGAAGAAGAGDGGDDDEFDDDAGGPFSGEEAADDELSLSEASELVGVSARALRDRVQRGSLEARKVTREGRVLSVVKRSDLLRVYGWMVAEGERKRVAESSGSRAPRVQAPVAAEPVAVPAGDLRRDMTRLQSSLADLTSQMNAQRQDQVRQLEQEIRLQREQERLIAQLSERVDRLAEGLDRLGDDSRRERPAWELVGAVLLLVVVVLGLWIHFQGAESARQRQLENLRIEIQKLQSTVGAR